MVLDSRLMSFLLRIYQLYQENSVLLQRILLIEKLNALYKDSELFVLQGRFYITYHIIVYFKIFIRTIEWNANR